MRDGAFPTADHTFPTNLAQPEGAMKVARSIAEYAATGVIRRRAALGFVPTMGALHDGHRSLIRLARARGDQVAVSIFVNPLQFGPGEDYARYPRPIEADLASCAAEGVDIVVRARRSTTCTRRVGRSVSAPARWAPCSRARPGPGTSTACSPWCLKLFNIIRPDVAVFGQKDAQQLACIQRLVVDLNVGVEVVGGPIIREPDGLAMSSRNVFLSPPERSLALSLSTALEKAATQTTVPAARAAAYETLDRADDDPAFDLDYATLVHPTTFAELPDDYTGPAIFAMAAQVGRTRLIDNANLTFG